MCGIIGYIGAKNTATLLIRGLQRLEYRGYDSYCGSYEDGFYVSKEVYRVQELEKMQIWDKLRAGIAHTRWATHGVTVDNAHPHLSPCENVVLVHNGIIENFSQLKQKLTQAACICFSDRFKVIAHLVTNSTTDIPLLSKTPLQIRRGTVRIIRAALRFARGTWGQQSCLQPSG